MSSKIRMMPLFSTDDLTSGEISLGGGFLIRDIKGLLSADDFRLFQDDLSKKEIGEFLKWDLCLVREFESDYLRGPAEKRSELLSFLVMTAFRWLHPTEAISTWHTRMVRASQGTWQLEGFSTRENSRIFLEDYETRALARPERFQEAGKFLTDFNRILDAIECKSYAFTPIVFGIRLAEQAYLESDLQLRFLKRMMALEALVSTDDQYGAAALLSKVKSLLGKKTPIYPDETATYTVGSVLEDMCRMRNAFAHGSSAPREFMDQAPESSVASDNVLSYADVLREASAMMVRAMFLRIFREGLVDTFADKSKMEAFFASGGARPAKPKSNESSAAPDPAHA
jgi:hypothetical protein